MSTTSDRRNRPLERPVKTLSCDARVEIRARGPIDMTDPAHHQGSPYAELRGNWTGPPIPPNSRYPPTPQDCGLPPSHGVPEADRGRGLVSAAGMVCRCATTGSRRTFWRRGRCSGRTGNWWPTRTEWLRGEVWQVELSEDRVRDALLRRCRSEHIEPPGSSRITRVHTRGSGLAISKAKNALESSDTEDCSRDSTATRGALTRPALWIPGPAGNFVTAEEVAAAAVQLARPR